MNGYYFLTLRNIHGHEHEYGIPAAHMNVPEATKMLQAAHPDCWVEAVTWRPEYAQMIRSGDPQEIARENLGGPLSGPGSYSDPCTGRRDCGCDNHATASRTIKFGMAVKA